MKIKYLVAFVVLFNILSLTNVSAETVQYKWKDANGEIHYTERPPASGVAFETIRIKTHAANIPTESVNKAEKKPPQKNVDDADEKYNNWRQDNCKRANQNLDILQNAGRISQDDGQGGTRLMTDEEKQAQIKAMTEQKDKYCSDKAE